MASFLVETLSSITHKKIYNLFLIFLGIVSFLFTFSPSNAALFVFAFVFYRFIWQRQFSEPVKNIFSVLLLIGLSFISSVAMQPQRAVIYAANSFESQVDRVTEGIVTRVIDGDSIVVNIGGVEREVRYIGIDTPEIATVKEKMQCFGKDAATYNARLVLHKRVMLEKEFSEADTIHRLLRHVYLDGELVSRRLVEGGYARVMTVDPDIRYSSIFHALESQARQGQRGLWERGCLF